MIDTDTFVTVLYVLADDFCKANLSPDIRPGPCASLNAWCELMCMLS